MTQGVASAHRVIMESRTGSPRGWFQSIKKPHSVTGRAWKLKQRHRSRGRGWFLQGLVPESFPVNITTVYQTVFASAFFQVCQHFVNRAHSCHGRVEEENRMHGAVPYYVDPGPPVPGGGHDGGTQFGVFRSPVCNTCDQHENICRLDPLQVALGDHPDLVRPVVALLRGNSGEGSPINRDLMATPAQLSLDLSCPLPLPHKGRDIEFHLSLTNASVHNTLFEDSITSSRIHADCDNPSKNLIESSMSEGCIISFSVRGVFASNAISVFTQPGHMDVTFIPHPANSRYSDSLNPTNPNF